MFFLQQFGLCEGKRQRGCFLCLVLFKKKKSYIFKIPYPHKSMEKQGLSLAGFGFFHLEIPRGIFYLAGLGSSLPGHS